MQTLNLNRMGSKLKHETVATISDFKHVGDNVYRVIAKFSGKVSRVSAALAISEALDNKATTIEDSFRKLTEFSMTGYVSANRTVRDVKDCESLRFMSGKRSAITAGNMLMDNADNSLWEVKESSSGDKYLVRQENEDLSELMTLAHHRSVGIPSLSQCANVASTRDFVAFVDTKLAQVKYGFVTSANNVIERDSGNKVSVSSSQVIETASIPVESSLETAAPAYKGADEQLLMDYYNTLYRYAEGSQFLDELQEIIRTHSTA